MARTPAQWADLLSPASDVAHASYALQKDIEAYLTNNPREQGYTTTELAGRIAPGLSKSLEPKFFNCFAWVRKHKLPRWVTTQGTARRYGKTVPIYIWRKPVPFDGYAKDEPQPMAKPAPDPTKDTMTLDCFYCGTRITTLKSKYVCSNPECPGPQEELDDWTAE